MTGIEIVAKLAELSRSNMTMRTGPRVPPHITANATRGVTASGTTTANGIFRNIGRGADRADLPTRLLDDRLGGAALNPRKGARPSNGSLFRGFHNCYSGRLFA